MNDQQNSDTNYIAKILPVFERARLGDFSTDVPAPQGQEGFTQLYEGIDFLLGAIREKSATLAAESTARARIQQDFTALTDNSPDIIARFDHDLRYVYINPTIEKITGITPISYIGKTNKELGMPEEEERLWAQNLTKVFQSAKEVRIEYNFRSIDGQLRFFQARLVPELAQNGSVQYVLSVAHDVTEIKKQTKALEEARIKDQAILSNMGEGLIVTDSAGRITLLNKVAQELLGWTTQDAAGKLLTQLIPMEDGNAHVIPSESRPETLALTTNKQISATYFYKKRDNTIFPVAITVTPLVLGQEIVGSIEVFRDVTRSIELDHAKDEFISLVSHELRTPPTAVKGLVSMALNGDYGEIPERLRQPLTNVYVSAERQVHVINDLLNISRLQTGRIKYTLLNFSLEKLTQEVVRSLEVLARQKRISLVIEGTQPAFVQGDDIWVKEILHNILVNAVKFTKQGGVKISYRVSGDQMMVVVTDTGAGIDPAGQARLFGKFEQLSTPELGKAIGSGLGLYIARSVARKMGGDVVLEKSVPGQGSTFVLILPIADTPRANAVKTQLEKETELSLNR